MVSSSGNDSAVDSLADFQSIAPTIVLDYGSGTWQDVTLELGEANIISCNGPGEDNQIAKAGGPHAELLTAETPFILSVDDEGAKAFAENSVLANLPSIQNGQVYGLGENSFRIDYYSATEIVDSIATNFAK